VLIAELVKVLLLEDDSKLARFLTRAFQEDGYVVDTCTRGEDALAQAQLGAYDVLVLDWNVPEMDGLAVCRELRRMGHRIPIVMLTARHGTPERVLALDSGADDFVPKPFEIDELLARVRAVVRRTQATTRITCGELAIDRSARSAELAGVPLTLTPRELAIVADLATRADRVVGRSALIARVWELSFDPGSNIVDVHVSRLRDKLGEHAWMLETVRGLGYRLRSRRAA
jgi:DNA-binding response OmpR family regulator